MINAKDISILIVDDDPELLESITSLFSIFGFSVDDATGGVPAWEKVQAKKYDIIISDVKMPDMNGLELLKKVRSIDAFNPKVLLISGHTEHPIEDMLELGANGFFSKPFNATAVRDSLTQTLLSPADRWSRPTKKFGAKPIHKKFDSFSIARSQHDFNFGQSGFFIHLEDGLPLAGDHVDFDIEFKDSNPFRKFTGSGHVAWARHESDGDFKAGVGVQIDYLDDFTLKNFIEWADTNKPTATVPKG